MSILSKYKKFKGILTFRKLLNLLFVKLSFKLGSSKVCGMPPSLFIEPTNICNVKCPLCPTWDKRYKKKRGYMSFNQFKKIVDRLSPYLFNITLWNYGEPFLNKDIYKMIKYAKNKNIHIISSTNGYGFKDKNSLKKLMETGIDRLIVSLDGLDQKTLSKYRVNANFQHIFNGLNYIRDEKKRLNLKKPIIELQFVVMKHNEAQIEKMKKFAKELGVNEIAFKSINLYDNYELASKFLPRSKKYNRYTSNLESIRRIKNGCSSLWFGSVIDWNGNVIPCCYDAYEYHVFGNVFKEKFSKIWNNKKYKTFRKQVLKNKSKIPLCAKCASNMNMNYSEIFKLSRLVFKQSTAFKEQRVAK